MNIELRRAKDSDEVKKIIAMCELTFGFVPDADDLESLANIVRTERMFGAFDGNQIVGSGTNFDLALKIPGGEIPAAGVSLIAVLPTHRRQGLLRKLMDAVLIDAAEQGDPVSILWASESSIYHRFGYGCATRQAFFKVERDRFELLDKTPPVGRVRLLDKEEALRLFPSVYDQVRSKTPGILARGEKGWEHRLRDPEKHREGATPNFLALHETDGVPTGYVIYNMKPDWAVGPKGKLLVKDLMATTPDATRDLWRFIFGVDLIETVETELIFAEDDPLQLLVTEPRRLQMQLVEALWLRILDLPRALEARSYLGSGDIVLAVADDMLPENQGSWSVQVKHGTAVVVRTDEPADLDLHIKDLAATYLGAFSLSNLIAAGRAKELADGAAERFDGLFRTPASPCCPEIF
jgi:predicted acetyltransferase